MSILIPSDEELQNWEKSHNAMNAVWESVLGGRLTPAVIGFTCVPPGKLTNLYFAWSKEKTEYETEAIYQLGKLGPQDGIGDSGYAFDYWLGVPRTEYEDFTELEYRAWTLGASDRVPEAEKLWHEIHQRCDEVLGADFPKKYAIYFRMADMYFDLGRFDEHDEYFEKGLQVLENCFAKNMWYFSTRLCDRLNELADVYLGRDDRVSTQRVLERLERHIASAPYSVATKMQRNPRMLARYYARNGEIDKAAHYYKLVLVETRKADLSRCDKQAVFAEAAKFFVKAGLFAEAEDAYEQILVPFLEDQYARGKEEIPLFMAYKRMLRDQGRTADLEKLNERLTPAEIKAGVRASEKNLFGYIDKSGHWQIARRYVSASPFIGGKARVRVGCEGANNYKDISIDREGNELCRSISKEEEPIIIPEGYEVMRARGGEMWAEGLAIVARVRQHSPKNSAHLPGICGYMNKMGEIEIPAQFSRCLPFHDGFAIVAIGGYIGGPGCVINLREAKHGLINRSGGYVIPPQFTDLRRYGLNSSLYMFYRERSAGVISADGTIITELDRCYQRFHLEGDMAEAKWGEEQKTGYLDADGKIAIPAQFESGGPFRCGRASVSVGAKWGIIDTSGNLLVAPKFESFFEFEDDIAVVQEDTKYGVIDTEGNYITEAVFDEIKSFEEGIAQVVRLGKWGLIDRGGRVICKPQFDKIGYFLRDLAIVERDGKMGFLHRSGKLVTDLVYADLKPVAADGLACAAIMRGADKIWGYLDLRRCIAAVTATLAAPTDGATNVASAAPTDGATAVASDAPTDGATAVASNAPTDVPTNVPDPSWRISPQFLACEDFSEGMAAVSFDKKQFRQDGVKSMLEHQVTKHPVGYIDETGSMVIPPQFDEGGPFIDGIAKVGIYGVVTAYGLIDRAGTIILPPEYGEVGAFSEGLCAVGRHLI